MLMIYLVTYSFLGVRMAFSRTVNSVSSQPSRWMGFGHSNSSANKSTAVRQLPGSPLEMITSETSLCIELSSSRRVARGKLQQSVVSQKIFLQ